MIFKNWDMNDFVELKDWIVKTKKPCVGSFLKGFLYILQWFISRQRFWNIISLKENCFVNEHLHIDYYGAVREFLFFSLYFSVFLSTAAGSDIKPSSGLSTCRSSKYSHHIRDQTRWGSCRPVRQMMPRLLNDSTLCYADWKSFWELFSISSDFAYYSLSFSWLNSRDLNS